MIQEFMVCDWCTGKEPLDAGLVPDSWYQHDGRHYCSWACLVSADSNLTVVAG